MILQLRYTIKYFVINVHAHVWLHVGRFRYLFIFSSGLLHWHWDKPTTMMSSNINISALLALCAGNSPVTGVFPSQRPVARRVDVFFDLRLNKRLSEHSRGWWFETPQRRCDVIVIQLLHYQGNNSEYTCNQFGIKGSTSMDLLVDSAHSAPVSSKGYSVISTLCQYTATATKWTDFRKRNVSFFLECKLMFLTEVLLKYISSGSIK